MIKRIYKIGLGVVLFYSLGFMLLIGFYIWMTYGIHPSDEGTRSVACIYDSKQKQYTEIEIITIINPKRVRTSGTETDYNLHLK